MFNFDKRCPIQLKDVRFKRCGNKRRGSGSDFTKQEVMSLCKLYTYTYYSFILMLHCNIISIAM